MISSVFGKRKPAYNVIFLGVLLFLFLLVNLIGANVQWNIPFLIQEALLASVLLFSLFVLNFITLRNKLTGNNSYAVLFFLLLVMCFPDTLADARAIPASFFLLLAMRRILSIKSLKDVKLKIFDASLWILVASLFYPWALLFLLLVLVAIYFYQPEHLTNWAVPCSALVAFVLIGSAILAVQDKMSFWLEHYAFRVDGELVQPWHWERGTVFLIYVALVIILAGLTFVKLGSSGKGSVVSLRIMALSFAIGIVVSLLEGQGTLAAVMVTFYPAAIFLGNYVEAENRMRIKELFLGCAILLAVLLFGYYLIVK